MRSETEGSEQAESALGRPFCNARLVPVFRGVIEDGDGTLF